jgi:hypothetical protein
LHVGPDLLFHQHRRHPAPDTAPRGRTWIACGADVAPFRCGCPEADQPPAAMPADEQAPQEIVRLRVIAGRPRTMSRQWLVRHLPEVSIDYGRDAHRDPLRRRPARPTAPMTRPQIFAPHLPPRTPSIGDLTAVVPGFACVARVAEDPDDAALRPPLGIGPPRRYALGGQALLNGIRTELFLNEPASPSAGLLWLPGPPQATVAECAPSCGGTDSHRAGSHPS